jgi:hypothetical protein
MSAPAPMAPMRGRADATAARVRRSRSSRPRAEISATRYLITILISR